MRISIKDRNYQKEPIKLCNGKNTTTEMKISLKGFNIYLQSPKIHEAKIGRTEERKTVLQ